jgi:hypothetical protein
MRFYETSPKLLGILWGQVRAEPLYLLPILDNCVGASHNVSLARVVPESSLEQNTLNLSLNKVHSDTYRLELKTPVRAQSLF